MVVRVEVSVEQFTRSGRQRELTRKLRVDSILRGISARIEFQEAQDVCLSRHTEQGLCASVVLCFDAALNRRRSVKERAIEIEDDRSNHVAFASKASVHCSRLHAIYGARQWAPMLPYLYEPVTRHAIRSDHARS